MTDLPKHVRDITPAEAREAWRKIRDDHYRRLRERSPPENPKGRLAASFRPKEMDAHRESMGFGDRPRWSDIDRQQARWEKDPAAVAARDADIARVARLVAERGGK